MRFVRSLPGVLLLGLVLAGRALGQVTVELVLDQEQYLRDESLPVEVRITNRSGQDLHLGQTEDWLTFSVERKDGRSVAATGRPPLAGEFTLESSMVVKRRLDLMPYFDLDEPGRYVVTAQLKLAQWNQELFSKPKTFDITRGTRIWDQTFGVPAAQGLPEVRRYELIQANNLKRLMLYLRIADETDLKVFRVVSLGQLVSFSRPEAQVDKQSQLHLLFQTGARTFLYFHVTPDGEILKRHIHEYTKTRPTLKSNDEGTIFVNGGQRRFLPSELPVELPATSSNLLSTNPPAPTSLTNPSPARAPGSPAP